MAMRASIRSASRAARTLEETRSRPCLSSRLPGRPYAYVPLAGVHSTSRKTQEAAALRQDADVFVPIPEAKTSTRQSPYASPAEFKESLRSYLDSAQLLHKALKNQHRRLTAPMRYELADAQTLKVYRHKPDQQTTKTRSFDAVYLRDRCPCPQCISPSSGNKSFSTAEIPETLEFESVTEQPDGSVHITWKNDVPRAAAAGHVSVFPAEGTQSMHRIFSEQPQAYAPLKTPFDRNPIRRVLWNNETLAPRLQKIDYNDFIADRRALRNGARGLAEMGLLFLTNVPQTETAVADIALRFGAVKETFYGRTWDVISKPDAENVAYTSSYLGLHSDMLYLESPPRIQLLHCLENSCSGGESIFSDAFQAAKTLENLDKNMFNVLNKVKVPYHYSKNGFYYRQQRPVFDFLGKSAASAEVWWSPPFQAPFHNPNITTDSKVWRSWHKAARKFQEILEQGDNMFQYKLQPGECVLFDNRRVLHGRRAFDTGSGRRWLKGTYVADEDFVSTLNSLRNDKSRQR
ncbi:gamma-butyrobetaine dioxygenase (TfdA family Taurine catabolism dioxygenase) [Colletotrichum truncatum]|uniref:Gamma-butyrobetaine dioxygenase (TfdA family Taurine catabolism dioxygenase) n=1 Tax=Colletotrichum truncatum TaxID=5467 RepID=A0ACC3ZH97_COLTU|nr:gamma-butyrobetaine dioxygenase (TfdA family Taurine catabolism dioxygenase) [Colletotrichum truncatum]KAF6790647.1 gamma-butyrobetaine dioxygenase (TfdA family Taurine catabolism dioxygenase) [Colletotrichum truncatum]